MPSVKEPLIKASYAAAGHFDVFPTRFFLTCLQTGCGKSTWKSIQTACAFAMLHLISDSLTHRLTTFIDRLESSGFTSIVTLVKTLRMWAEPIAGCRFTKNNGITEGFHRKMKLIQRRAYGFKRLSIKEWGHEAEGPAIMPPVYNGIPTKSYRTLEIEHKDYPEVRLSLALRARRKTLKCPCCGGDRLRSKGIYRRRAPASPGLWSGE